MNVQEFFVRKMSTKVSDNKKIILEVKESGSSLLNEKVNTNSKNNSFTICSITLFFNLLKVI